MEVAPKKWEPGLEPYHAFHAGTTQKPGVTLRGEFAVKILSAILMAHFSSPTPDGTTPASGDQIIDLALAQADLLIAKLYPPPVSKTQMNTGHVKESSSCAHDGEIIMANGRFQCMKCKYALSNQEIEAKMRK